MAPDVWPRFTADPRVAANAAMRAGDADRDLAGGVLREAFADGRLSRTEYDERSDAVLAARSLGDLLVLITDVVPPAARAAEADLRAKAVQRYRRDLRDARNGWVFVSLTTLGVWAATSLASGGLLFFWPVFPILGVGVGYASVRLNAESRIETYEDKLAETRRIKRARREELDD